LVGAAKRRPAYIGRLSELGNTIAEVRSLESAHSCPALPLPKTGQRQAGTDEGHGIPAESLIKIGQQKAA
jgi:hypothetical protein